MDIVIRKATMDDLEIIQTLNNELFKLEYENFDPSLKVGWPFGIDGKEYFSDLIENQFVLIACAEDKIVGYLAGSINVEESYNIKSLAELDNMFIKEEYRKYGIGTKLFQEFKNYCRQLDIDEIKVTASAKNINAINFYKKNGFEDFDVTFKMLLI